MTIFNFEEHTNQEVLKDLPKFGRLLGIDVGTKRIGLALSDASRFIASPKLIINRVAQTKDFEKIKDFIAEQEVVALVIGRPVDLQDNPYEMTFFAENFAKNLDQFLQSKLPIFLFEERYTSAEARDVNTSEISRKKRTRHIDDIAASFILQHFLDSI